MPRNITGSPDQRKAIVIQLLASTDWYSIRQRDQEAQGIETTLTLTQWSDLLEYRQELRDWPSTGDYNQPYPIKPEFIK
jgi:hypothetical protein